MNTHPTLITAIVIGLIGFLVAFSCQSGQDGPPWSANENPLPVIGHLIERYYYLHGKLPTSLDQALQAEPKLRTRIPVGRIRYSWSIVEPPGHNSQNIAASVVRIRGALDREQQELDLNLELGREFASWVIAQEADESGRIIVSKSNWNCAVLLARELLSPEARMAIGNFPPGKPIAGRAFVQKLANRSSLLRKMSNWECLDKITATFDKSANSITFGFEGRSFVFDLTSGMKSTPTEIDR